jgi:Ala-tRNA(Pro) deacylase
MNVYNGMPDDISGRAEKEIRAYKLLLELGIEFQRVDHAPAMTMEACADIDKALGTAMCKNLFLCNRQMTQFYLLLMPGDKPFKTKDLSYQIGTSRLSFATEEHMADLLDLTPGSATVLGLMNDKENSVTLLIDEAVLNEEYICCHPCVNTSSVKIKTSDVLEKLIPVLGNTFITVAL